MCKIFITYEEFINEKKSDELLDSAEEKRIGRAQRIIVEYSGMIHRDKTKRIKTIKLIATDPEGSGKPRNVRIKIPDYRKVSRLKRLNTVDKINYAVSEGDIYVNCDCPDFLYKGYKYMATQDEYGIYPEDRYPVKNNPDLEGSVCKHIIASFEQIDEYYDNIEQDIKDFAKKDSKKR